MKKHTTVSSRRQITTTLLIFVIPFVIFLICYNTYTVRRLNDGIAETGQHLINIYKSPVEMQANILQQSIVDTIANDVDFQQLVYACKKHEKYVGMKNVADKFQRIFSTNAAATGCIMYEDDYELIKEIYVKQSRYGYKEKEGFKNLLRTYAQSEKMQKGGWTIQRVEDAYYLFCFFRRESVFVMGIYDLENTQKPQNYLEYNKNAFLFFTDSDLKPVTSIKQVEECNFDLQKRTKGEYYFSGSPTRYLIVQDDMGDLPIRVFYAVPYYGMFISQDMYPVLFLGISVALIILLWFSFRMLMEKYLNPFQRLVETMERIRDGDMEVKMEEDNKILEFQTLSRSFNEMMEEIKALKIFSYEYQLEMQQAKLQYLQIQIRPHFFLNCLKNLYGLAEEGRSEQIQKTILILSEHLRYMMRDNFSMIPIQQELQSVENFILLQQLTSSWPVTCRIDIEEELRMHEIPPMSILTFVENAIKHGARNGKQMKIEIRISRWSGDGEDYMEITIFDNGNGFSEESLKKLRDKENYSYSEQHVGIQNVKHRFALIYKEKVNFLFSNITGSGACVQIIIPEIRNEKVTERKNG